MVRDQGLPSHTVIITIAISLILVLLGGMWVVLSWGMDVTQNYEQKAVYIYLGPDEFAALKPPAIKEYICRGAVAKPTRETSYGIERRGLVFDTRYEVYRETKHDAGGMRTLQPVMQFTLKECLPHD